MSVESPPQQAAAMIEMGSLPDNEGLYKYGARCRVIQGSGPTISADPESQ